VSFTKMNFFGDISTSWNQTMKHGLIGCHMNSKNILYETVVT